VFETSFGNVFADLGLPDTDRLKVKSGLVIEITKAVRKLGLTQDEAARRPPHGHLASEGVGQAAGRLRQSPKSLRSESSRAGSGIRIFTLITASKSRLAWPFSQIGDQLRTKASLAFDPHQ
jgi:hypothetical protein